MHIPEILEQIRQEWLSRVSRRLTMTETVRKYFAGQLAVFFDALIYAAQTQKTTELEAVLRTWVEARTQTEDLDYQNVTFTVLNQILVETFATVSEELNEKDALEVLKWVLPIYTHCTEIVIEQETQIRIKHVAGELDQAKNTLERLEKSKSDFISVAAHELRTPLTLIEGYISMLMEVFPTDTKKSLQTINQFNMYIRGIHTGTRRLREIVDDMIDVSMIDNNLLALNFQPVWINRLLDLIQREVANIVTERRQNLKIHAFPGSEEMTFGDGERLLQALRNVITNAIKYTPDEGKITVDGRQLPGFIEIVVTDTGIGIDPLNQTHIFEKFGRLGDISLHSTSKTRFKGGGPGLGLPITKGIIEAHGGTIWVESAGHDETQCPGSTFHILLPLLKTPPDDRTAKLFHPFIKALSEAS